jgi:hypothetical protein
MIYFFSEGMKNGHPMELLSPYDNVFLKISYKINRKEITVDLVLQKSILMDIFRLLLTTIVWQNAQLLLENY